MVSIEQQVEPAEVGLDQTRLARIDRFFGRYVTDGLLTGWLLAISRHGRVAHVTACGLRDVERGLPVEANTVWRLYSMSKPVASVAVMMLAEEGGLDLDDPVERFVASFANPRVFAGGSTTVPVTVPAKGPIRIWHLLSHTSGLTYAFHRSHPVDELYRQTGFGLQMPGKSLAEACDVLAGLPLLFEPGTEWNYSHSVDVLGRVIEVVSDRPLGEFLKDRIFDPLGMVDTGPWAGPNSVGRLANIYTVDAATGSNVVAPVADIVLDPPEMVRAGDCLVGTAHDYHRFALMLRGRGEVDGVRLLSPQSVEYMTRNHLPGGADIRSFHRSNFDHAFYGGMGFGLGFSVVVDPVLSKMPVSAGQFGWSGAANTQFWVDPVKDVVALFFTQLFPPEAHPVQRPLRSLVSQAIVAD